MARFFRKVDFWLKGHNSTLNLVFANPPPATIRWSKIEGLLRVCGATVRPTPANGTRWQLNGVPGMIEITPLDKAPTPIVRYTREFLEGVGVTPATIWLFLGSPGATL
jgi:hypothetical protein